MNPEGGAAAAADRDVRRQNDVRTAAPPAQPLPRRARARVWRMRLWVLGHHKRRSAPPITLYMYVVDMNRQGLAANCERDLAGLVACLLDCPRPTTRIKPATGLDSNPEGFKKRYKIRFDRISGLSRVFQRVQPPTACALLRAARLLRASVAALPLLGPPALACSDAVGAGRQRLNEPAGRQCEKSKRMQLLLSSLSSLCSVLHMCWSRRRPLPLFFCCSSNALGFTLVNDPAATCLFFTQKVNDALTKQRGTVHCCCVCVCVCEVG